MRLRRLEMAVGSEDQAQETLRRRAKTDDPLCDLAWADMDALAQVHGEGSAAETAAVRRTDCEAWVPGLEARPTVMRMGWTIFAAVLISSALSWLPMSETLYAVVNWTAFGICAVAVAASVWSILSEMRGWEGSNAAYWFRKGRLKRYRKAREARHRRIAQTLLSVNDMMLTVYRLDGDVIIPTRYPPDTIETVAMDAGETHMSLRLATATDHLAFDWLRRDAAFEAAVERLRHAVRTAKASAPESQRA